MLIPLPEIVRSVTTENPWWDDARILKGRNLMEISVETERTEHWLLRRERDDPCE